MPRVSIRCTLPPSHDRRGGPVHGGQLRYVLPMSVGRQESLPERRGRSYALGTSGFHCQLPKSSARAMAVGAPRRLSLPMEVSRDATVPAAPAPPLQPATPPAPAQAVAPPPPAQNALPPEALLPIVERVARGSSGAAGYGYMGEDPQGAGLRYGLLGLRLDTGDMGRAMALAQDRDAAGFAAALGEHGQTILATITAADPAARLAPIGGSPLWAEPWKSLLSSIAGTGVFRAAQNEYAAEGLLRPAAERVLTRAGLATGTALAMALDVLAEMGRDAGLAALEAALATQPDTTAALQTALTAACPACRLRLDDLARDPGLVEWRPASGVGPQ